MVRTKRELHADQHDALDLDLALQKRFGRKIDIGLGGLGDDAALGVEHPCTQDDEVHPPLVAGPFDCGLVVFDGDPGQRACQRIGQRAAERAKRNRTDQQADARANDEKQDRRGRAGQRSRRHG